jgi:hypothetical protein
MKMHVLVLAAFTLWAGGAAFGQSAADIGKQGDARWTKLIGDYTVRKQVVIYTPAREIVKQFDQYRGTMMECPDIVFEDFITDRKGDKYYYCSSCTGSWASRRENGRPSVSLPRPSAGGEMSYSWTSRLSAFPA